MTGPVRDSAPWGQQGQFLGTLDYISPEQIEGKTVDGRADEYALACAAFELLTGMPPFRRDEAMAVMYAQLSEPPPLLTSRRPDLKPAADQVFARALAKAPGDRHASCREFADARRAARGARPRPIRRRSGVDPGSGSPANPDRLAGPRLAASIRLRRCGSAGAGTGWPAAGSA